MPIQAALPAHVAVPASTSNLGPGFDLLGLAVSLFLHVEVRARDAGARSICTSGEGCSDWPTDEDNKLLLAFACAWERLTDSPAPALEFRARSEIPVGRGLGSSAAAIVAGLLLADHLSGAGADRNALLSLAVDLEGHPDNVTPALFGGCTATLPRANAAPLVVRHEVHPSLAHVLAWPSFVMETARARALLPESVPFEDAVDNSRRLAMLLEGLRTGDGELLRAGAEDRLHVPYRVPEIAGAAAALQAAHEAGAHLATLSGSGSALFALAPRERAERIARAMEDEFVAAHGTAWSRIVEVVEQAPQVTTGPAASRADA